jgi:hypothetical protein
VDSRLCFSAKATIARTGFAPMKAGQDSGALPGGQPEAHRPARRTRRRRGLLWAGIILLFLLTAGGILRAFLPQLVRDHVNRTLDRNLLYEGRIGEAEIHLLRGAYSIDDVHLSLNDLALTYGGFDFKRGWFDLVLEADSKEGQVIGYVKPLFRDLKVFSLTEDLKEDSVPQFFWQALVGGVTTGLKNVPRNQFGTLIPFTGDATKTTTTDILATIGNILRNAFVRAYLPRLETDWATEQDFHFDAAVGDLKVSLDRLQIANIEQKELLAIIESTRPEIVHERLARSANFADYPPQAMLTV